jgi:chromosome partitioning protein
MGRNGTGEEGTRRKPIVVTFSANKGGVGKTRMALLTANCLGAAGKKVLAIDMDFNNSATFYYLPEGSQEESLRKNIADALSREENDLHDFTILTEHKNVSLILSSRYLADLRSVNEKRLNRMIKSMTGDYDFVIIDCQPDYNNLTLNAINAGDLIITPVLKDLDSFNAAVFLEEKISIETDKHDCWFITINGYNRQYDNAQGGKQKEYIDIYKQRFESHITDPEAWYPWTTDMNEIKDRKRYLSEKPLAGAVCNPKLFNAVISLSECFIAEEHFTERPEKV